jgi:hypothetical protein
VLSIGARLRSGAPLLIPPASILTIGAAIANLRTDSYPGWFALPFAAGRLASWDPRFPADAQEVALLGVLGLSVVVAVSVVVIELRRGHWRDLLWDNLGEFLSPAWLKGGAHRAVGAD